MTYFYSLPTKFPFQREHIIKYLYKIGYYIQGSWDEKEFPSPSFETLCKLMECHLKSIPFGCLNLSYLKLKSTLNNQSQFNLITPGSEFGVSVNIHDVYQKLVLSNREGFCLEQNSLFKYILEYLGFDCLLIIAKVVDLPHLATTKQTIPAGIQHVGILLNLNSKVYYVDVGFAPLSPSKPLELGNHQPTLGLAHIQNRVVESSFEVNNLTSTLVPPFYEVQYRTPLTSTSKSEIIIYSDWRPQLYFYKYPCQPSDLEIMNAWITTSPNSFFRNHIILSKFIESGQIILLDNELKIFKDGKLKQKIILNSEAERRNAYKSWFGINLEANYTEVLPLSFNERI